MIDHSNSNIGWEILHHFQVLIYCKLENGLNIFLFIFFGNKVNFNLKVLMEEYKSEINKFASGSFKFNSYRAEYYKRLIRRPHFSEGT